MPTKRYTRYGRASGEMPRFDKIGAGAHNPKIAVYTTTARRAAVHRALITAIIAPTACLPSAARPCANISVCDIIITIILAFNSNFRRRNVFLHVTHLFIARLGYGNYSMSVRLSVTLALLYF